VSALRVAVVMPPATDLAPEAALEMWPTFTRSLEALHATGNVDPMGCCRSTTRTGATVTRNGIDYSFDPDDRQMARRIAAMRPDVVHLHGLGFTRLLVQIRRAVGAGVPILLQHHGEQPPTGTRSRFGRRMTRGAVTGYLFTGGSDHAEPFRRAGVISATAPVYEILESASNLDEINPAARPVLGGSPCVLWVGRLIPSKDPLCAVLALAAARDLGSTAMLHMLATDRSLEPDVRRLIDAKGLGEVVHLHPPVAFAAMTGWYRRVDTYLSTSHHEGSNYSLIEALGFGCRPVVTEIPPHAAIVRRLAPRFVIGDAQSAGAMLAAPAAISREQITTYSRQHLSWTNVAEQLLESYRRSLRT
jgi:glycosyltransferase involved in cell wall biosynthesis